MFLKTDIVNKMLVCHYRKKPIIAPINDKHVDLSSDLMAHMLYQKAGIKPSLGFWVSVIGV